LIGVDIVGWFVVAADPEALAIEALATVALAATASVSNGSLIMDLPL